MLNVDIKNITIKTNSGIRVLLSDIKFNIVENNIYTILGKNGSGKSTLIKSITRLLNEERYIIDGKVFWFDKNIFEMNTSEMLQLRKNDIRYVLQDLTNNFDPLKKIKYYFDKYSINENVIGIKLKEFLLPDYQTISNLHSYEISGGMAQRLSFMLAILTNPKLLILDEPTSAIDYVNMNLMKIKLKNFIEAGSSVLVVTQDINFAKEISDKISFMYDNKLSEFVEPEDFFKDAYQKPYNKFLQSFNEFQ